MRPFIKSLCSFFGYVNLKFIRVKIKSNPSGYGKNNLNLFKLEIELGTQLESIKKFHQQI